MLARLFSRLPQGEALADAMWAFIGTAIVAWMLVDSGAWAKLPMFWKIIGVTAAVCEIILIIDRFKGNTLSERLWKYLPDRPLVGFILGCLSLYMFHTPEHIIGGIWFLLMGHFVFYPKPPTDAELFALAARRYRERRREIEPYLAYGEVITGEE